MLEVFDPTQGATKKAGKMAPRPSTLDGASIGIIWNGRPVGTVILDQVIKIIRERYRIKDVVFKKKTFVGNITPPEIVNDLAERCQVVITGVGDWGSCTSGSVLDALMMERKGIPAAAIAVEKIAQTTGKGMARVQGFPDYPIAGIPHEMGMLEDIRHDPEAIERASRVAAEKVISILTRGVVE